MRIISLVILLHASQILFGQVGRNKQYDFGQKAATFASIVQDSGKLLIYGIALEEGQNTFGLLLATLDVNGNILKYVIFNDSLGDDFTQPYPKSFIKLQNDFGYAGVGQFFARQNGYLALFDKDGVLEYWVEYPDSSSRTDLYFQVLEVKDGLLIAGIKQRLDYVVEIFIMKTNMAGEKLWEKKYGLTERDLWLGSILSIGNNEFVIGSATTSPQNTPIQNIKNSSRIFAIDSVGQIKWNWESALSTEELGVGDLYKTSEGNWAYNSARSVYNSMYNEIWRQPKLIERNADFDLLSNVSIGTAGSFENSFYRMIQMNNGGWLSIGTNAVRYDISPQVPPGDHNAIAGWTVRWNNDGNMSWNRVDTANWNLISGSENYLYSAVELTDGNIVAVGYTNINEGPLAPRSLGWLIKLDQYGCMDSLDCATSPVKSAPEINRFIRIFPNPASEQVYLCFSKSISGTLSINNILGLKILEKQFDGDNLFLDVTGWASGIYVVKISQSGNEKWIGRFIVQH